MTEGPVRSNRMEVLLGAAVQVVAENGLRGLTHRTVDRRAGLPEGSCSAYPRTREALVLGVTEYVAERVAAHVRDLADELAETPLDDEHVAATVTHAVLRWVDERDILGAARADPPGRSRPASRRHDSSLRHELVEVVSGVLSARRKPHRAAAAETLCASFDGVLIAALPRPPAQRRAFVRRSIETLMAGLG
jgi:AcrR family transcriptional regulator